MKADEPREVTMITLHRNHKGLFLSILCILMTSLVAVTSCSGPAPSPMPTPSASPTEPAEEAQGKTIIVKSTADSEPGTLRQALLDAESGDTITFDPAIFPPGTPATIYLTNSLPFINQDNLTVDASSAGVILDGSNISGDWAAGLEINSDGNTIQGLQMVNFYGAGIVLSGGAQYNMIGGDRSVGPGPVGQGNLVGSGNVGIGLWDDGTSFNTITGNLIGTDPTGADAWSNDGSGVYIEDGASHNIIGPENSIAYNNGHGVEIVDSNSFGNTISQNSIHDNEGEGIYLCEGGNTELNAPLIIDFDLAGGTVTGSACVNCTIEVFSDSNNEGQVYEGQVKVDSAGAFTFKKGASFAGLHMTATATDVNGNTSEFAVPTLGTGRSVIFQEGNNLPRTQFQPRQSRELEDNRVGQMAVLDVYTEQDADHFVYQNNEQFGFKWVRLSVDWFDWSEVESTGTYSEHYINPNQDRAITGLVENGIKIMYTLVFWDEKIQAGEGYSRFKREDEIQGYLDYARFIVRHFKDRIEYYEILNEPNIGESTQQYVEVADYINLVRRTIPIIHQEDPKAKIVVGAITPFSITPGALEYFFTILSSDIMPLVDAVSWHACDGTSPEYMAEFYYNIPSLIQEIKDAASSHGFDGEYIVEEVLWRTPKDPHPLGYEYSEYGEIPSAKYYARGIVMYRGMDLTTGLALENLDELPHMVRVIRNLCTVMAGAKPIELPIEIESEATNIRSYGFSLSNGDKLLALWTDGVAVDDDAGVEATLTLPGFSAQKVIGIDILNGFEQELVTSSEDGNLVIRDLLIRDYPIILRLID